MVASLIVPVDSSLIKPVVTSFVDATSGKGQEGGFLPLLGLPLMMKFVKKRSHKNRRWI